MTIYRCYECGQSMTYARLAKDPWLSVMGEVVCDDCVLPRHVDGVDMPVLFFNRDVPLRYRSGRRCPPGQDLHAVVLVVDEPMPTPLVA